MISLILPIVLSAVALFFASFLSWMVFDLHRQDWRKIAREDDLMRALDELGIKPGNYAFPTWETKEEMNSEAFKSKWQAGPSGILTVFGKVSMGRHLALTFVYFLVVSFCLAYLATLAIQPGASFMIVFRFMSTAALLAFLPAILAHSIWFHARVTGHVIESIVYAAITGAIFAALWPCC